MIKKVKLYNWKSHKETEFQFSKGTNVLTGIIGAGKSTVIEAICYALFGTYPALNSKSVNLNEIIMNKPNQMEESKVELEFNYNNKNYLIKRTVFAGKNSNQAKILEEGKLIAGPKPNDVNKKIEEILEMNYDLFSRAVYSEQNQIDFFLKLSPMQRKKKFDEILELDKYENARKTNVSVINRIKKTQEEKKEMIQKHSDSFDENALKELNKKKQEKEKQLEETKEKQEKEKTELKKYLKELETLEKKEKQFKEIKEKIIKFETKISEITKKTEGKELEGKESEKEENKLNELKKEKNEIEKKLRELSSVKAGIKAESEKKEFLEKEKNKKKELLAGIDSEEKIKEKQEETENKIKKIQEGKKETEKMIEELEKEILETKNGITVNEKRIAELEENIKKLTKSESDCPICSTKLSKEKKIELINSCEKEEEKIRIINKSLTEEERKITQDIKEKKKNKTESDDKSFLLEEEKNRIKSLNEKLNEIKETQKQITISEQKLKENNLLKEKLEKEVDEEKIKEKEKEIKTTENEIELIREFLKCKNWKNELQELTKEKERLCYAEYDFSEKKEKVSSVKSSVEFSEKEIKNTTELIESIKSNIEKTEKEKNRINQLKKETELQEKILSELALFNNALNATQAELRKEMIDTINEAMDDVWNKIYPYGDFISAKMEIEEGNYEIKVKEKNGKWVRVEGILSGGERSAAAICIRVAFSLVLTQNLSWLILDEPTHNLDKKATTELSKMMKNHLPNLVEQIFIITHDPEMEKAASGSYYEIERDKENEGSSIPKEIQ